MSIEKMNLDEYKSYNSSMASFTEMWKSCYFAMLSNPEYYHGILSNDGHKASQEDFLDLSWKYAKELKRATTQYLENPGGG
jgi:hypothetical protein